MKFNCIELFESAQGTLLTRDPIPFDCLMEALATKSGSVLRSWNLADTGSSSNSSSTGTGSSSSSKAPPSAPPWRQSETPPWRRLENRLNAPVPQATPDPVTRETKSFVLQSSPFTCRVQRFCIPQNRVHQFWRPRKSSPAILEISKNRVQRVWRPRKSSPTILETSKIESSDSGDLSIRAQRVWRPQDLESIETGDLKNRVQRF